MRMADAIDEGQESGEVASQESHGRGIQTSARSPDTQPTTLEEIGVPRQRLHEWRELRDAGQEAVEAAAALAWVTSGKFAA